MRQLASPSMAKASARSTPCAWSSRHSARLAQAIRTRSRLPTVGCGGSVGARRAYSVQPARSIALASFGLSLPRSGWVLDRSRPVMERRIAGLVVHCKTASLRVTSRLRSILPRPFHRATQRVWGPEAKVPTQPRTTRRSSAVLCRPRRSGCCSLQPRELRGPSPVCLEEAGLGGRCAKFVPKGSASLWVVQPTAVNNELTWGDYFLDARGALLERCTIGQERCTGLSSCPLGP